jgi:PAS domain S-box-containing protein
MDKLLSYEDLQKKIEQLEKELSRLYSMRSEIPSNTDPLIFFKISEYSKNAVALFETNDDAKSFTIKYFNKKAEEVENINRKDIVGKKLADTFPSVLKSGFHEALQGAFRSGKPEEFISTLVAPGKIIEWKRNYIYKLSDTEMVSIYIDEKDKKNNEFELKLNQEKLQIAMEAANYYPFEINLLNKEITTNPDLYANLGYANPEIPKLMQATVGIMHPDDYKNYEEFFVSPTKKDFVEFNTEFRIKAKQGNWIWFIAKGKNIEWDNMGNPLRVVGLLKSIQEEKEILSKLQESEENFRQLADNINDAFWLRSVNHKVIYANQACFKIVGDEFKKVFEDFKAYKNWIHPEDRTQIVKQRELNLINPHKIHCYEHRIIRPDGNVRWLWIRTFPLFNSKGELYRRAGIASDITEQKNLLSDLLIAKNKAEESDRLKSSFLANMSHEIRTPMNGILGFAELLKEENISDEDKTEYLKIIDANGKQLLNLLNDIIDVAKIEAGQILINNSHSELNTLLKEIFRLFIEEQKRLKKQDIQFTLKIPDGHNSQIYTDINRLHQILNNLLSNAFKFTEFGSIQFGYEIINNNGVDYFQFFVADTGIGINETMKDFIFERFGQVQTTKFKNNHGTGLGLAISKGLIELLKGKIWLESVPENLKEGVRGYSTFYFTIPIINTKKTESNGLELKSKPEMKTLENIDILVVEDDEDNLEFLRRLVIKFGANAISARTGEEAVELVKTNANIKIVLMDIRLPDMDGFETTQIIKKLKPNLPVIAQTAYALYNDREICLENGCDDYISKPLDKEVLFKKINKYIYY